MIHILFAASSDYAPYALVTGISAIQMLKKTEKIHIHFMYADIVHQVDIQQRQDMFDLIKTTLATYEAEISFYNVESLISKLKGQNIGMWGENVSLTHYIYLLAPEVLAVDKVIYLDTDMIVNTDLSEAFHTDMGKCLLGMAAPRGCEEMGEDVSNSGFVVLNLALWRQEKTLDTLLSFGRKLPKSNYCDQNLLYQFFTKRFSERLYLFDKRYNIFPQLFKDLSLEEIKILHYTGWYSIKPWYDFELEERGSLLWWYYAQKTPFEACFLKEQQRTPARKFFGTSRLPKQGKSIFYIFYLPIVSTIKTSRKKEKRVFGICIKHKQREIPECIERLKV